MKITRPTTAGNAPVFRNITWRQASVWLLVLGVGALLWKSPLFAGNWLAIIGYGALVSVVIGETPTKRPMLTNTYGVLFKKPTAALVCDASAENTLYGVREVIYRPDFEAPLFKLWTGNVAMVYSVTSGINQWSTPDEYAIQTQNLKILLNIMEEGETYYLVTKKDSDMGLKNLIEALDEHEKFEGDDLKAMSDHRRFYLNQALTTKEGRSIQQYVILVVREKNIQRTSRALKRACQMARPAAYPADVLLAAMGMEGGIEHCG